MNAQELKRYAREKGADLVGIAPIARFESLRPERSPISIFPECRSVIVLGRRILRGALRGVEEGTNFNSTYGMFGFRWLEDNFLSRTTYDVTCHIESHGFEAVPLFGYAPDGMPVGHPVAEGKPAPNVIVDLDFAAQAAGLGEIGLGGFFLPWLPHAGREIPPFDFRVKGVSSISADLHKYAYAAKGASILLYRNRALLRHQVFAEVNWCGGAYGGLTLAGTRPGGPIAAAWAALRAVGKQGYIENAKKVMTIADRFRQGVASIPGLQVLGEPVMGVMAIGSNEPGLSIYAVADQMEKQGWHIDRLQRPEAIHLILNPGHEAIADAWLEDLRKAVETVRARPELAGEGSAPLYGLMARMPVRGIVRSNLENLLLDLYAPGHKEDAESADSPEPGSDLPGIVRAWFRWRARRAGCRR